MSRGRLLLELTVYGRPAPAGSKTADPVMRKTPGTQFGWTPVLDQRGRPVVRQRHANPHTEPWMKEVEEQAAIAWRGLALLSGALWIDLECFEPRPQGHFRTGQFRHLLRPDAPAYPSVTTTGDSGKLRRAVEDALTDIVWEDDKRVVDGHDRKVYGDEAKAIIRVGRMDAQTVTDLGLVSPDPDGQENLLGDAA